MEALDSYVEKKIDYLRGGIGLLHAQKNNHQRGCSSRSIGLGCVPKKRQLPWKHVTS
jgi:hypothetical protein